MPPHLDAVATSQEGVVALESKCTEYFFPKVANFSERYFTLTKPKETAWFSEMKRVNASPQDYAYLDVAQLLKHALGLINCVTDPSTLLYIYWEPNDADCHAPFAAHRAEIERFETHVSGSGPAFSAISYPELWTFWLRSSDGRLRDHAERLFLRYGGTLGSYEDYSRVDGRKTSASTSMTDNAKLRRKRALYVDSAFKVPEQLRMQEHRDECEVRAGNSWELIGINEALERRGEDMRCPECNGRVQPHREYSDGARAHFEHRAAHRGCSTKSTFSGFHSQHPNALT